MYDPSIGRWLTEDPEGFQAGDPDLYRYVGNNATNLTDPSGLQAMGPHHPARLSLWRLDWPGITTPGYIIARSWDFREAEQVYFRRGCVGLCAIRTGSYLLKKDPMFAPGVECFTDLKDALKWQKEMNEKIKAAKTPLKKAVLFAIESKNPMTDYIKYLDKEKKRPNPESLTLPDLEPYDFATAFQKTDGTIVYWERMPYGISKNPDLNVDRTAGHVYKYRVYCVVVTDCKYQPHTVANDDHPARKRLGR
jgi:hypothetical protein